MPVFSMNSGRVNGFLLMPLLYCRYLLFYCQWMGTGTAFRTCFSWSKNRGSAAVVSHCSTKSGRFDIILRSKMLNRLLSFFCFLLSSLGCSVGFASAYLPPFSNWSAPSSFFSSSGFIPSTYSITFLSNRWKTSKNESGIPFISCSCISMSTYSTSCSGAAGLPMAFSSACACFSCCFCFRLLSLFCQEIRINQTLTLLRLACLLNSLFSTYPLSFLPCSPDCCCPNCVCSN